MKLFAGKSPTERNKIIAAIVLGVLSLFSLWIGLGGGSLFSSKPSVTVSVSPTPKSSPSPNANRDDAQMPSRNEIDGIYTTIPVVYSPVNFGAPDAGRNIFAFYEPPKPTPYVTPSPVFKPPTPIPPPPPTPTPEFLASSVTPQSVYAGQKGFRLEVYGDRFTPDSRIYFNGNELATVFVSPQKLTAEIAANLIAAEGARQIIVQTPDGKFYSNQMMFNVQAPPKPDTLTYIGMIARKGYNNDTAYFQDKNKKDPFTARLNDTVAGRFRLFSISPEEVVLVDKELGFPHPLRLSRPVPGQNTSAQPPTGRRGDPRVYNPNINPQEIPGIPSNIPRYVPPPQPRQNANRNNDDDDDDDDGKP